MPTVNELGTLYGELRAELLARHFAVGRHFQADLLSLFNRLGVLRRDDDQANGDQDSEGAMGCWPWNDDVHLRRPSTYDHAGGDPTEEAPGSYLGSALLSLPKDDQEYERWRVGDHQRENPLMFSGQLLICLAVESAVLNITDSKKYLLRALKSIGCLYKFHQDDFSGYVLRWDPVTSDKWVTDVNSQGQPLKYCYEFLIDSSHPGGYLYCTPLSDVRYTRLITNDVFQKMNPDAKDKYYNARKASVYAYRSWEPSMDELVGLIMGYDFVFRLVQDDEVKDVIRKQVRGLGAYLAANGYMLVRPEGGFAARGASGVLPAFEFSFGKVFKRITGEEFSAQIGFEESLKRAGVWSNFSTALTLATICGIAVGLAAALLAFVTGMGILGVAGGFALGLLAVMPAAKAWAISSCSQSVDVWAWPGDGTTTYPEERRYQNEFVAAYGLRLLPVKYRFTTWFYGVGRWGTGSAIRFPPFIGLTGLDDPDSTVRDAYLDWLPARRDCNDKPQGDDSHFDQLPVEDPFASAIAVVLGAGPEEEGNLAGLLAESYNYMHKFCKDSQKAHHLALIDDGNIWPDLGYQGERCVIETFRPGLNYMASMALVWYYAQRLSGAGRNVSSQLDMMPDVTKWPSPSVPGKVLQDAQDGTKIVLPEDVEPGSEFASDAEDMLEPDAPARTPDPPSPDIERKCLHSDAIVHTGLSGHKGDDAVNAGKVLSGTDCVILGVTLELVDDKGVPLTEENCTTWLGGPDAETSSWGLTAGARITQEGTGTQDETVKVHWWFDTGRACRYRIAYLVQGQNCSL